MEYEKIESFSTDKKHNSAYSLLFHKIAGTDICTTTIYKTKNNKVFVKFDEASQRWEVFFYGNKVAVINKQAEKLYRIKPYLHLGNTYNGNIEWSIKKAFEHYKIEDVFTFSYNEYRNILQILMSKAYKPSSSQLEVAKVQLMINTANFFGATAEADMLFKKFCDSMIKLEQKQKEAAEREEKRRKEAEERRQKDVKKIRELLKDKITGDDAYHRCRSVKKLLDFKQTDEIVVNNQDLFDFPVWGGTRAYPHSLINTSDFAEEIGSRLIKRYGPYSNPDLPDFFIVQNNTVLTSQGCEVAINNPFKTLLKAVVRKIKKQESCDDFIGSAVGAFEFRGVNYEERYVSVGCHRFLIEDVLKLAEEVK